MQPPLDGLRIVKLRKTRPTVTGLARYLFAVEFGGRTWPGWSWVPAARVVGPPMRWRNGQIVGYRFPELYQLLMEAGIKEFYGRLRELLAKTRVARDHPNI